MLLEDFSLNKTRFPRMSFAVSFTQVLPQFRYGSRMTATSKFNCPLFCEPKLLRSSLDWFVLTSFPLFQFAPKFLRCLLQSMYFGFSFLSSPEALLFSRELYHLRCHSIIFFWCLLPFYIKLRIWGCPEDSVHCLALNRGCRLGCHGPLVTGSPPVNTDSFEEEKVRALCLFTTAVIA